MAKYKGAVVIDREHCKGCGVCVVNCPKNVLENGAEVNAKGYPFAFMKDAEACIGCSNCAVVCPDGVITVYREKVDS